MSECINCGNLTPFNLFCSNSCKNKFFDIKTIRENELNDRHYNLEERKLILKHYHWGFNDNNINEQFTDKILDYD